MLQIVQSLPEDQWRDFVKRCDDGNIFHTPEMFEVYRRSKDHYPELWAALQGSQIVALMSPVRIALTSGIASLLTSRSVVYGSVLVERSADGEQGFVELLRCYQQHAKKSSLFTELRNVADLKNWQPVLQKAGFIYEEHLNYLIKLDYSEQEVFEKIGPRTRKHIRKGLKRGEVEIVEVTKREQIPESYELLQKVYSNAHVPLADISLLYNAFELLVPKGMARFTLAYIKSEPAAVSIELLYKDTIYGWFGGMDRKFTAHVPNEILMWSILQWGCNNGYKLYDFGGAGRPDEEYGVRDFKAKFGGDLVCFGRNMWIARPILMAVSKSAYSVLRRICF